MDSTPCPRCKSYPLGDAEVIGTTPLANMQRPAEPNDVDVVRAALGVGRLVPVLVTEQHFRIDTFGFLARPSAYCSICGRSCRTCITHTATPSFTHARYAVLLTGASATADMEGILLRGARGTEPCHRRAAATRTTKQSAKGPSIRYVDEHQQRRIRLGR